jgi:hypothetical protein
VEGRALVPAPTAVPRHARRSRRVRPRQHVRGRRGRWRYRVAYEALEPLDLPAYLGSTLRGAFGRAFRQLCCPARDGDPCPIPASCPYHLVFETLPPPGADALSTHEEIPRPFVIAPPPASAPDYPAETAVVFDLTLVGRARGSSFRTSSSPCARWTASAVAGVPSCWPASTPSSR